MYRRFLTWYSRHRINFLLGGLICCVALAVLGLWCDSEAFLLFVGGMMGVGAIILGRLMLTLYPLVLRPTARIAALKVGKVFPPDRLLIGGYLFM